MGKLGIIAGSGRFPLLVAEGAREKGLEIVVAGLRDNADPALEGVSDSFAWVSVAQIGSLIDFLRHEGIEEAVMAGGVNKKVMFSPLHLLRHPPDARATKLWFSRLKDRKDSSILTAVIDEFAAEGIHFVSTTKYLPSSCLARIGAMTRRTPTERELEDIRFGARIAATLADMDVGQSIIVKDKVVVAVEAVEGTDETIRRGGKIAGGEATLVKFCRTHQDMRFDVPTTGLDTVATCAENGVSTIAVEGECTVMLDREKMIRAADARKICLYGVSRGGDLLP